MNKSQPREHVAAWSSYARIRDYAHTRIFKTKAHEDKSKATVMFINEVARFLFRNGY